MKATECFVRCMDCEWEPPATRQDIAGAIPSMMLKQQGAFLGALAGISETHILETGHRVMVGPEKTLAKRKVSCADCGSPNQVIEVFP